MDILNDLNLKQKLAVTHRSGPLMIVAGAGTGKTTVITRRLAWLIEQGLAQSNEILALTFTDKASEEMSERVDKLLPYGYVDLWVSTFHSFCERILKAHGLDIGLSTNFKLLTQTDQWLLVRQNLDKFDLDYYRPLGNPTKFIQALISHFSHLKDEEIWPEEYLEYAEKLQLDSDSLKEQGGVVRSKKYQISNIKYQTKSKVQNPNNLTSIKHQAISNSTDASEISRITEVANAYHVYQRLLLENNYLDFGDLINYTLKLFRTRQNLLSQFQNQFKYILVDEFQDTNWAQYDLVKLLAGERQNLTVVGDDDQAVYKFRGASLANILQFEKDFPDCAKVVLTKNYRSCQNILDLSYKFIQLNNPNRLEAMLMPSEDSQTFGRPKSGTRPPKLSLSSEVPGAQAGKQISKKLESQLKSSAEIKHLHLPTAEDEVQAVVNKIIELKNNRVQDPVKLGFKTQLNNQIEQTLWSDFAILVRANSGADAFCRGLAQAKIPYQFLASKGLYAKPVIMDVLAYFKLLDNYHESVALYRMLNSPMFKIAPADQSKLTYQSYKTANSLYESLQKIAAIPGISEDSVKKAARLLGFIEKHSDLAKEKHVGELYVTVLKDLGYEQYLVDRDDQWAHEQLNCANQFYKRIQKFEAANLDPKLRDFMFQINLELEAGEQGKLAFDVDIGPDMVKIMTAHGAKGLEFKYVFIANLVDKRFPTIERSDPIQIPDALVKEILPEGDIHLEEERRLFYVAMTRAKLGLYFTSADDYGGTRSKKLSRFLYELGLESSNNQETTAMAGQAITKKYPISNIQYPVSQPISNFQQPISVSETKESSQLYLPNHFSFSQLAAFKKCPLQYKFNFILHIPVYGKAALSFGRTMHSTLQKFFAQGVNQGGQNSLFGDAPQIAQSNTKLPSLSDLLKLYQESWLDDWYESKSQKQEYKEKGQKILKDFYSKVQKAPPQVAGLETYFNLRLNNYTVTGRIDRVDKLPDGVELIDYKTGGVKDKLEAEDKEQLLLYQIAAQEVFRQKPAKLTYWYLEDNQPVSFLGTGGEIENLKKDILIQIEKIRTSDFSATPGWQCQFCDFKEICEFRAR